METTETRENQRSYSVGVIISLLLHVFFALILYLSILNKPQAPQDLVFSVDIVPTTKLEKPVEKSKPRNQIVETPQEAPSQAPDQAPSFQSEKDFFTPKQQIRRGDDAPPSKQASKQNKPAEQKQEKIETQEKQASKQDNKKESAKPLKLKLDPNELGSVSTSSEKDDVQDQTQKNIQEALAAASSANEKSSVNVSRLGSRDYLPDIPDGEVTLLNTKANEYAVFVRRVASQVFANLRGAGWQNLNAADIRAISKDSVIEAVMSPNGQLLSVSLVSTSQSPKFDSVLKSAIQRGVKDPNPPAGAEAQDGNIHFTFQARSWLQYRANSRGAAVERRWLLLGTGLD